MPHRDTGQLYATARPPGSGTRRDARKTRRSRDVTRTAWTLSLPRRSGIPVRQRVKVVEDRRRRLHDLLRAVRSRRDTPARREKLAFDPAEIKLVADSFRSVAPRTFAPFKCLVNSGRQRIGTCGRDPSADEPIEERAEHAARRYVSTVEHEHRPRHRNSHSERPPEIRKKSHPGEPMKHDLFVRPATLCRVRTQSESKGNSSP